MNFQEYKKVIEESILFTPDKKKYYILKWTFYREDFWIKTCNIIKELEQKLQKFPQAQQARERIKMESKMTKIHNKSHMQDIQDRIDADYELENALLSNI